MPVDPWATTTAQEFPPQEPDTLRRLAQIIAAQKREMFDLRASVLANVSDVVADLRAKQAALEAQQAALEAVAGSARNTVTNFSLSAGMNTIATATLTVPTWATTAIVTVTVALLAHDMTTGGLAFVEVRAGIGGDYSTPMIAPVTVGASVCPNMITMPHVRSITSPGSTIACVVQAQPSNPGAYPVNANNVAAVNVIGIFLR